MDIQKKKELPLVTVGIPVYNDEKYVATAIEDILAQTYDNLEIIIADNCSTDGSESICRSYAAQDARVHYVRHERNTGPQDNFRYLLNQANGVYFMWAASDDRWDSEFVERLVYPLENDPQAAVTFCNYAEIDEQGTLLPGRYCFDFGSTSPLRRIIKFHITLSSRRDSFIYGLFRRSKAVKMKLINWWWINKIIPMGCAYPPLTYILAAGNFHFVATDKPLWFNRVHLNSKPRHSSAYNLRPFFSKAAFFLRKLNELIETERAVVSGSRSILLGILAFPILASRCLLDCLIEVSLGLRSVARRLKSLFKVQR